MTRAAVVLMAAALASGALAQDSSSNPARNPPDHFYKLNLVVQDTNDAGKITNERAFMTFVETAKDDYTQSIRSDDRVPVAVSPDPSQFNRVDVGIDFDIRAVKEMESALSFRLRISANSAADIQTADGEAQGSSTYNHEVLRQNRWESGVLIPIGKPTIVFSADRLEGKGKMQVVVTATRVE